MSAPGPPVAFSELCAMAQALLLCPPSLWMTVVGPPEFQLLLSSASRDPGQREGGREQIWAGTAGRCLLPPLGSHLLSAAFCGPTLAFLSLSPPLIPSG